MKLDLKNLGLRAAGRLGLVEETAHVYDTVAGLPDLPKVDSSIRQYEMDDLEHRGKILLPVVQGRGGINTYMDCLLAHAFRTRGYEPTLLLCDTDLDMCFAKKWVSDEQTACEFCHFLGDSLFERFNLEYRNLGAFVTAGSATSDSGTYRGVDIEHHALSSTRAYLQKYHIDREDDHERTLLDRFEESARILTDVAHQLFEKKEFDAVVSNNSSYIIGGVFLDAAEKHGISGWDLGTGWKPQSVLLGNQSNRSSLPSYEDTATVKSRLSEPLTDEEENEIKSYLNERMAGKNVQFDHTQLGSQSFNSASGRKTYGVFTNLLWDASLTADNSGAFDDTFAWLDTTISHFCDRPTQDLFIKTHPAETLRETNEAISDWINKKYDLPENIIVLPPETDINPYEFMQGIDTGIVWNSTAGLEMSYLGIPTIVAGDTHYREFGFTFDASDPEEYRSLLGSNIEADEQKQTLAKRYAYLLFIERHVDFPFYKTVDGEFRLKPCSHDQLTPGNEALDILTEAIITDTPVPKIRAEHKQSA